MPYNASGRSAGIAVIHGGVDVKPQDLCSEHFEKEREPCNLEPFWQKSRELPREPC